MFNYQGSNARLPEAEAVEVRRGRDLYVDRKEIEAVVVYRRLAPATATGRSKASKVLTGEANTSLPERKREQERW
jgi:hypothetical protein